MIKAAVNKGIMDIKENPERGIRNLIDLAMPIVKSPYLKNFLSISQKELQKKDSAYYSLVAGAISDTNTDLLTNIGINLGYICWSAGANTIRAIEEKEHFNIPWIMTFDTKGWQDFDMAMPRKIISEGKNLGIYCYEFFIDKDFSHLDELLAMIKLKKNRTFLLMTHSSHVNEKLINAIHSSKNIFVAVDCESDEADFARAVSLLKEHGCFFAAAAHQINALDEQQIIEKCRLLEEQHVYLLMIIDKNKRPLFSESGNQTILKIRTNLQHVVLPIDVFQDMANLDRSISAEPCLVQVSEDGRLLATDTAGNSQESTDSIMDGSLKEMLRSLLPKAAK